MQIEVSQFLKWLNKLPRDTQKGALSIASNVSDPLYLLTLSLLQKYSDEHSLNEDFSQYLNPLDNPPTPSNVK